MTASPGPGTAEITVRWNPASGTVDHYAVYRNECTGGLHDRVAIAPVGTLEYVDTADNGLDSGTTYCYVVTAVAPDGTEGLASNEASATAP